MNTYKIYLCTHYDEIEKCEINSTSYLEAVKNYSKMLLKSAPIMFKLYDGKWVSKGKKQNIKNPKKVAGARYYSNGKKMLLIELIKE